SVARTCVLAADAGVDPTRLVQLAEKGLAGSPRSSFFLGILGSALYRAGKFDRAVGRLEEACKVHDKGGTAREWLFLAMAHQRLGNPKEAGSWLEKEKSKPKDTAGSLPWNQRLEHELLRREAEKLLKEGK